MFPEGNQKSLHCDAKGANIIMTGHDLSFKAQDAFLTKLTAGNPKISTVDGQDMITINHFMECILKKLISNRISFRRSQQERPSFNYLQAQERPRNLVASPLSKGHFVANRNDLSQSQSVTRSPQCPGGSKTHDFTSFSEATKRIKTWAEKSSHRTWIQS